MAPQVVIRSVERADFAHWQRLWEGYNTFYGRTGAMALAAEVTHSTWQRFLDPHEPMYALIAERAGAMLGLVHFIYHRSTTQLAPVCYLEDLFTVESARGQGVARALIEAVYARARADQLHSVYWQTHESNVVAMRLYDKIAQRFGFLVYDKTL
jgi:GNAT superfamily N-acetyltransferase